MCALVSSRPNRIASAQPPANAAPNTSAPIRIAAEMTVMTLGQTIRREDVEAGCGLMKKVLLWGRNLSEKAPSIKRKRPKNAASRAIDCRIFWSVFERNRYRFQPKKTSQENEAKTGIVMS